MAAKEIGIMMQINHNAVFKAGLIERRIGSDSREAVFFKFQIIN